MAVKTLSIDELKTGDKFYTITTEDKIELWHVVKREGWKFALRSEGGPAGPDLATLVLHGCSKYKSRALAEKALKGE